MKGFKFIGIFVLALILFAGCATHQASQNNQGGLKYAESKINQSIHDARRKLKIIFSNPLMFTIKNYTDKQIVVGMSEESKQKCAERSMKCKEEYEQMKRLGMDAGWELNLFEIEPDLTLVVSKYFITNKDGEKYYHNIDSIRGMRKIFSNLQIAIDRYDRGLIK